MHPNESVAGRTRQHESEAASTRARARAPCAPCDPWPSLVDSCVHHQPPQGLGEVPMEVALGSDQVRQLASPEV